MESAGSPVDAVNVIVAGVLVAGCGGSAWRQMPSGPAVDE